jgi:hypothetical protein
MRVRAEAQSKIELGVCLPVSEKEQCLAKLRLGEFPLDAVFEFKDDRFVSAFSSVSASAFGTFKDIFIARYGKPLQDEIIPGDANSGSGYETLNWAGKRVSIRFAKTASTPGKAVFRVALNSFLSVLNTTLELNRGQSAPLGRLR